MGFYDKPPVPPPAPVQGGPAPYKPPPYPGVPGGQAEDFYKTLLMRNQQRIDELKSQGKLTAEQFGYDAAATALMNLRSGGGFALPIGYANLAEILGGQGKTDPARLNMQLTDISRTGQANQMAMREQLAQQGLAGSGVGLALQTAQGQATQNARSGAIAQENQLAEERRRTDLQLMYDLILNPTLQTYGALKGVSLGQQQLSNQKQQQQMATYAALIGALACWVAREVYGVQNPKWLRYRHWMLNMAEPSLRSSYLSCGPSLARWLRHHPEYKRPLRIAMDRTLAVAGV